MGDYLFRKGDYAGARGALNKALAAPARPGRAVADEGATERDRRAARQGPREDRLRAMGVDGSRALAGGRAYTYP